MGENSKIAWCDHTFNPWVGCTKISAACDHCYAEGWAKRTGQPHLWSGERRRTSATNWRQPLKWNREAAASGMRRRVFCASLADVFDNQVPREWRDDLWALIAATPRLDWLLLTKRPQNIAKMLPGACVEQLVGHDLPRWPWPHVWLGTTVESQEEADRRIPHLLAVPAAVRFLSCEPLLGEIDLTGYLWGRQIDCAGCPKDEDCECGSSPRSEIANEPSLSWIIAGGESGRGFRTMDISWVRSLRDQCQGVGLPFFFKQWGGWHPGGDRLLDDREWSEFPRTFESARTA